MDCIFCKIIAGQIPSDVVYKDDKVIAFRDISPMAPVHLLIVPRQHIVSLNDVAEAQVTLVGHIVHVAKLLAKQQGIAEKGYRVVINCGRDGGQAVQHLHVHLLGGRELVNGLG
ncbi:MAG: histidine triad nucleotide-binding protein [Dehalococcoidales bacterium]|nr:histidine triad nucleotide-binding protein [Dehalococcoidales bacterium]